MILEQDDNEESDSHNSYNSEERQPGEKEIFSEGSFINGTTTKVKLGDIRVRYTQKTCKQATVLA